MCISDWSSDVCSSDRNVSSALMQAMHLTETGRRQVTILCCHVGLQPNASGAGLEQLAAPRSVCASVLRRHAGHIALGQGGYIYRSEEHTSELQSLMRISYAVFCLKKKKQTKIHHNIRHT